jgi:septum formation protein
MIEKSQLVEYFPNIVLASASPRRADLLKQIGLAFQIRPSRVEETEIIHTPPDTAVRELALAKAKTVAENLKDGLVIGADTVVVINQQVLGKPNNAEHAIEMLTRLSGKHHEVITGVALVDLEREREVVWAEKTMVQFRELHGSEILDYVRSGEALDKAGAYGIQGRAAAFVERIEGCYFNVVGLPLASLVEKLWELAEHDE